MKNKTFINLHLLKNGFADVDTDINLNIKQNLRTLSEIITYENTN